MGRVAGKGVSVLYREQLDPQADLEYQWLLFIVVVSFFFN